MLRAGVEGAKACCVRKLKSSGRKTSLSYKRKDHWSVTLGFLFLISVMSTGS